MKIAHLSRGYLDYFIYYVLSYTSVLFSRTYVTKLFASLASSPASASAAGGEGLPPLVCPHAEIVEDKVEVFRIYAA